MSIILLVSAAFAQGVVWEAPEPVFEPVGAFDFVVQLGQEGDRPMPGHYTGGRGADWAVWRDSAAAYVLLPNDGGKEQTVPVGKPGDHPVPGDYDGDGRDDCATWNPSSHVWTIVDAVTGKETTFDWGFDGDVPVPADYDGDGITDPATWRPIWTGSEDMSWWVLLSSAGFQSYTIEVQGKSYDTPVPRDVYVSGDDYVTAPTRWKYDPYGAPGWTGVTSSPVKFSIAHPIAYEPPADSVAAAIPIRANSCGDFTMYFETGSVAGLMYFVTDLPGQPWPKFVQWGQPGDVPVVADYSGDGVPDYAVYRPGTAEWFIRSGMGPCTIP